MAIQFARVGTTALYERVAASPGTGWLGFLLTASGDPAQIDIAQAWSDPAYLGYFIVLAAPPADAPAFAAALATYRADHPGVLPEPSHSGFAWLALDPGGAIAQVFVLPLAPVAGALPVVAARVVFPFANYGLPFAAQAQVMAIDGNDGIDTFRVSFPADLPGLDSEGGAAGLFLPLDGAARYAWTSQAMIGDFSDDALTGWDASIRYAYRDTSSPIGMRIQRYPLFTPQNDAESALQLLLDSQWDPLAPLDPTRTFLAFTGQAYTLTITEQGEIATGFLAPAEAVLPTSLRTVYGQPLALRPIAGSAKLVFQPLPSPEGPRFYLTPQGDFALVSPAAAAPTPQRLLCGLAGAEFMQVTADDQGAAADILSFQAGSKAFAPVFPVIGAASGAGLPLLRDDLLTAWVKPKPADGGGTAPVYVAQPRNAGLYAADPATSYGVLGVFDAPAARFTGAAGEAFFPLAPYAAVDPAGGGFSAEDLQRYEEQVLNPARRAAIAGMAPGPQRLAVTGAARTTTTPQGFLATIDDLQWTHVLLARGPEGSPDLAFLDLPDALRQALQSNQLFLVATRAAPLGDFRNRITLGGWPFTVDVSANQGATREFRNVVVFKFGVGSIRERLRDTASWTDPAVFNDDPLTVADWLSRYIEQTEQQVAENPRFRKFLDIVDNKAWNGVLMLRVDVGLEDFPEDLKGLLAGIVQEDFFGHHLGVEVNFVEQSGGEGLQVPQSSLFGLIAYQDRGFVARQTAIATLSQPRRIQYLDPLVQAPEPGAGRYDFRVLNLQVVFENSDIADFQSLVSLTTDAWFDEPARVQTGTPLNSILQFAVELAGAYENHDGHRTYTFNTLPQTSYVFTLESATLEAIEIVKAQFSTIDVRDLDPGVERIASRFTFWALLNFKPLPGFDAYSFGDSGGGGQKGLFISNLNVDMGFDFDSQARTASNRAFAFSIDKLALDLGQSDSRRNSLAANFPVTVVNLIRGGPEQTPEDLGFIEVQTPPAFDVQPLGERWFGLVFDLNLGSVGALAESAGFKASVLVAWSPGAEARSGALLIKLPLLGGGKKTLSLQNVLRLNIGTIAFETDDSVPGQVAYLLRLSSIALQFLGISLPPGAQTSALLFGDPDNPAAGGNLGWYAAYIKDEPKPSGAREA